MRKRYIQNPVTFELVPAEEYVRPGNKGPVVRADLEPFRSHVDGSIIGSRKDLREHNDRNNVVCAMDMEESVATATKEREDFYAGQPYDTKSRRDALIFAHEIHQEGRSKADVAQMTENYKRRN